MTAAARHNSAPEVVALQTWLEKRFVWRCPACGSRAETATTGAAVTTIGICPAPACREVVKVSDPAPGEGS